MKMPEKILKNILESNYSNKNTNSNQDHFDKNLMEDHLIIEHILYVLRFQKWPIEKDTKVD